MASPTTPNPPGFVRIGTGIWLVEAEKVESLADDPTQPTLILIFGWMDAKLAHVAKFSAGYRKLYPAANQLVIASTSSSTFFSRVSTAAREMQPALDYLLSQGVLGEHARPHRGCFRVDHLSKLIATTTPKLEASPLTKSAMVIDSSPGGDKPKYAFIAFEAMIPSPVIRYPALAALFIVHWISYSLGRSTYLPFEPIRQGIRNPQWLPWVRPPSGQTHPTPWLFVYSKADDTVPFEDVQHFTELAEADGMDIRRDVYDDTPHVGHMRVEPLRYWASVKNLWNDAIKMD
ncbi:hypothetical protein M408DRAFT_29685 [Serendipita vermifera MAFF 305830]|uniref:Peptidase S9 prolyl oligopeptidase catalytic domain-containing protein n=1 Tax=Serendipita vermifera MAFF 305830 TaxID=933852 RepID=A0A0C3AMI9_SERVB|nr:hypothetical protein M408DRAFT_29685 [Serendipita vermifera MAFF 305830]